MKVEFTCGNFNAEVSFTVPTGTPEWLAGMVADGIKNDLQRKPASAWEKEAAGFAKRPNGFQRNTIDFTSERASRMEEIFTAALPKELGATVAVVEHIPGEGGDAKPSKAAAELWTKVQGFEDEKFRKVLGVFGLDPEEDYDDEVGIKAAHQYLLAEDRKAKAKAKAEVAAKLGL